MYFYGNVGKYVGRPLFANIPLQTSALSTISMAVMLAAATTVSPAYGVESPDTADGDGVVRSSEAVVTGQLDTVTVSARRRLESAQDVPASMSVLSGEALEVQRVYRVQDLQQLVPSLNVSYLHPRQSSLSIRGLGNNPGSDGLEGSAGIYLDNVYLGRPGMAVFDLVDIEQLEVLRGPQGTLFGKNTTAGVLNITTRAPSFTTERTIETSIGSDGYLQTKGTLSGALTEHLAGRISLSRTDSDGDVKNEYDGHDLNGGKRQGFRTQLLYKPSETFNLRWIGEYNEEDSSTGTKTLFSTGPVINGVNRYETRAAAAGATLADGRNRRVNMDVGQKIAVDQGGTSLEANWLLPNDFKLTSISAYRWWNFYPHNEDDLNISAVRDIGTNVKSQQYSQEFRLASPLSKTFDYVLGAFYYGSDLDNESFTEFGPQADIWGGTPAGALANVSSLGHGHIQTNSFALFGQGTWHLTEKLDFTAGIRGTYEEKTARVTRNDPVGESAISAAALAARLGRAGSFDSGELSQYSTSPSGLLNLSYRITPDLLAYATLSHGEKSGGVNLAVGSARTAGADSLLIGTERANNAELGLKSTLWDRRLQLNAALFWTKINGYQANAYDYDVRAQYLTNAGSVRSRGIEFDSTLVLGKGWVINANGSYNDVTYLSYKNAPCPPEVSFAPGAPVSCDLTGSQVVGASKWIGNLSTMYKWNLDSNLEPYLTASYAFRSKAVGTLEDSDYGQIPAYAVVNLSAGLRGDLGDGQWDASVWVKNAFDKDYYSALWLADNGGYEGMLGSPRTVGVTARYDF